MKTKILSLFSLLILVVSILCSCFSDGHTHQFTDEFHKDDINHWHQCDCGEKSDVAEHTFDEGEVKIAPTEESKG